MHAAVVGCLPQWVSLVMGKLNKMSDDKLHKITKIWEEQLYIMMKMHKLHKLPKLHKFAQNAESPGSWASRPRRAR